MAFEADTTQDIMRRVFDATLYALSQSADRAQVFTATLQSAADANGDGVAFDVLGLGTIAIQVLKTGAGTTQVNFEVTVDDANWTSIKGTTVPSTSSLVSTTTASGVFQFDVSAFSKFRTRISATVGVISVTVIAAGVAIGTGGLSSEMDTELETDDLDTGVGTDTQAIVGIALAESGGHALLGSAKPMPLIAGQTSITGAAGAVAANTPRITHASDDPVTTALQIIDDWDESDRAKVNVRLNAGVAIDIGIGAASVGTTRIAIASDQPDINVDIPNNLLGITAKGQGLMANSLPVVLASDQNDVNVDIPNNLLGITVKGQATMANSLPVTLSSDEADPIVTALQTIDNMISGNEAQVDVVTSALPAGAATEATLAAASAKLPATLGQKASTASLAAVLSTEQEAIQAAIKTAVETALTPFFDSDGDNTAQVLKASAGKLYGLEVSNPNAVDAWIQLFNVAAGSVIVGTTTPNLSFLVPAGNGVLNGAMDKDFAYPINFGTAITYACTTTPTGNGDPPIGLVVNAYYV